MNGKGQKSPGANYVPVLHATTKRQPDLTSPADSQSTPMRNLTVLVLDDEPTARDPLTRFLAAHGYQSTEAGTMSEVIDVMRTTQIGAVILDVRLPGDGSGLDVLQRLREQPELRSIPAIIFSGGILTEDEERMVARHRATCSTSRKALTPSSGFSNS